MISKFIKEQLEIHKNQAILIGSANYPFQKVLQSRLLPFDLNAAEYTLENRVFPGCNILNSIEEIGSKLSQEFLHLDNQYKTLLSAYSGTQANQIIYNAILNKGDVILSFGERSGGHASHLSFLKKFYQVIEYEFDFLKGIDYECLNKIIQQFKPKLMIAGSTLFSDSFDYIILGKICRENNTLLLADISHTALYVATGAHQQVCTNADFITYTTHKTTRGIRSAIVHYKENFHDEIIKSVSSVSQGAPKYSDILCNTIMQEELKSIDLEMYQKSIFEHCEHFKKMAELEGFETIGNGRSHLLLLRFDKCKRNYSFLKEHLEKNNILVTCHSDNRNETLRFGFLTFATLKISYADAEKIFEMVLDTIKKIGSTISIQSDITNIMKKYTTRFYKENYGL